MKPRRPKLWETRVRKVTMALRWVPQDTPSPINDHYDYRNNQRPPEVLPTKLLKLQQRHEVVDVWQAPVDAKKLGIVTMTIGKVGGPGDDSLEVYLTERCEWVDVPTHLYTH